MMVETPATILILLLCWIILLALDALVCGLLHLCVGVAFESAFVWGLLFLILPPLAVIYGSMFERNWFEVRRVHVVSETLPESFEGYRVVHISDIHARSFEGRREQLVKAVEMINALEPDLIAFTGDLITLTPDELDSLAEILSGLRAKDGVVSVLGNHDYAQYSDADSVTKQRHLEELIERERSMGWHLLLNEHTLVKRGVDSIAVVGVENISPSRYFPTRGDLAKVSEKTDGAFRILLSHDPMHWESEVLGKDYPLTLSGHTHAMQLSLFGWSPSRLIFKQNRGLYNDGSQYLYVNAGLGETIFPARIGARPEITLLTLTR